jgi:hypothetical protein
MQVDSKEVTLEDLMELLVLVNLEVLEWMKKLDIQVNLL